MNSSISRILLDSGAFHFKISHQNYLISLNTHLWQKNKKKKILFSSTKTQLSGARTLKGPILHKG